MDLLINSSATFPLLLIVVNSFIMYLLKFPNPGYGIFNQLHMNDVPRKVTDALNGWICNEPQRLLQSQSGTSYGPQSANRQAN